VKLYKVLKSVNNGSNIFIYGVIEFKKDTNFRLSKPRFAGQFYVIKTIQKKSPVLMYPMAVVRFRTGLRIGEIRRVKELRLKNMWNDLQWPFPNPEGSFYTYSGIIKIWNRTVESSGFRCRTPHDLRHTYAKLRLSMGHPLPEVSKEMGHSTTRLTYETYCKWLPSEASSGISEIDRKTTLTDSRLAPTKLAE
jgi:hypothetical protein